MRKILIVALLAALVCLISGPSADAAFKIRVSDGKVTQTIEDGKAGDSNGVTGGITYIDSVSFAGWTLTVSTGQSKPQLGNNATTAEIATSVSYTFSGVGPATLTIDLTDTDFSLVNPLPTGVLTHTIATPTFGTATYQTWVQSGAGGNTEFGGLDNGSGTIFTLLGPGSTVGPVSNPFSMTSRTVITVPGSGGGSVDTKSTLVAVPVPPAIALLASAIPVGLMYLRRRNKA